MPVFNVAFMGTKSKGTGGGGYGILVDQLSILENELSKDGFLSPGDYDQLIGMAKSLMNSGALTSDQRSNISVKVSTYEKSKSVSGLDKSSDIEMMNRQEKDTDSSLVRNVGTDPINFMQGKVDSLENYINTLSNVITQKAQSGQDYSTYLNQYEQIVNEFNYRKDILGDLKSKDPNDINKIIGSAAYVTTNRKGEIVDVDYGRYDGRAGYAEVDATINGIPVFGKINVKSDNSNYFFLGREIFSETDTQIPDPTNPGAFTTKKLKAGVTSQYGNRSTSAGTINFDPKSLVIQNYVPVGGWAKGIDGSFYKRDTNGKFIKYINGDQQKLGITDNDLITIPKVMETSLMGNSVETIDASQLITPPDQNPAQAMGQSYDPFGANSNPFSSMFGQNQPMNATNYSSPATPTPPADQMMSSAPAQATARTSAPTERAPQGAMGIAQRTMQSGVNFFQNLFK